MNLEAYLLKYRTPVELAAELAQHARVKAALLNRVGELEHILFWMQARERDEIAALKREMAALEADLDARIEAVMIDFTLNGS